MLPSLYNNYYNNNSNNINDNNNYNNQNNDANMMKNNNMNTSLNYFNRRPNFPKNNNNFNKNNNNNLYNFNQNENSIAKNFQNFYNNRQNCNNQMDTLMHLNNNNRPYAIKIRQSNQNCQNNNLNQYRNVNNAFNPQTNAIFGNQNYNNNINNNGKIPNYTNSNNRNYNINSNYLNNNTNFNCNNGNFNNNNFNNFNNMTNFNNNNGNFNNNFNNLNSTTNCNNNNGNFNNNFNNLNNMANYNNNGYFNNNFNYLNSMTNYNNGNFNNNNFINNLNNNTIANFNKGNFNNNNFNNNLNNNTIANFNNNINNNLDKKKLNPKTTIPKGKDHIEINFMIRARGLQNVGATCYMNATLQCFYHVKPLTENLINDNNIKSSMEITYCYKNLIEELVGCKNKKKFKINVQNYDFDQKAKDYVEPNDFKNLISHKNPLFKGIKANDSKDLIIFLLENMDTELTQRNNKNCKREIFYGKDITQMAKDNFKKIHNSIFAELFYGFQKTTMECLTCNKVDTTFNIINFLIFPLEKVYNSLNSSNNNNNNNMAYINNPINNHFSNNYNIFRNQIGNINYLNSKTIIFNNTKRNSFKNNNNNYCNNNGKNKNTRRKLDIYDCFRDNESEEILKGENRIYCNYCNSYSNAKTKNKIFKAPNVLILIINRGKGNIFECDLEFPMKLDICNFTEQNSPKFYDLIGIISHFGESSMEGHFMAYCKHFDDNWYMFNDAIVKNVNIDEIYKGTPYILFYQNKDIQE